MATQLQTPNVEPQSGASIPFRRATVERAEQLAPITGTITAAIQRNEQVIEGGGFAYGVVIDFRVVTAANAAAVAFTEDAPWNALDNVILRDVNGELVSLTGYDLMIANLAGAQYAVNFPTAAAISALFSLVTGAVGTGGSFTFMVRVPIGINRRDLIGMLGNQDRAQKYSLRSDIAASGTLYTVAPTNPGAFTVDRFYENYSVPQPVGPLGQPQEVIPSWYGTFHYLTALQSEAVPTGGNTINHYLRRVGNTIRFIALVFRSNSSRATAETNAPTRIRLKVGENTLFNESYRYRRFLMHERYGFDFPAGVLVYDAMHDFTSGAGDEVGDDYYNTQAVNNAQFEIAYPAGFGAAGNSLRIITDDLQPGGLGPMVG